MGEEYENIYKFENLYRSYRMAARGKHGKADVIAFETDASGELWRLHDELEARTYRVSGYNRFMIHDPKTREIQALSFKDRVVQHSLCDNALRDYFERRLIYDCAACRLRKGTHFAMRRLSGFLRDFYREYGTEGYFLKCDVRKFFDNIDHDILKKMLRKYPDAEVKALLYDIIDSYHADTGKGLPMGNQTSQWFALYYLDRIDRLIKEKMHIRFYTRYMDDMVLIHHDREYLKACLADIRQAAWEERGLELNEKTQIFPISQGVDYLGWHFYLSDSGKVIRRLRTSNKRRLKRRLNSYRRKYAAGEKSYEEIKMSIRSYNAHLKHGHAWRFKKRLLSRLVLTRGRG
ncbi:MAG: reverse transcriptase [Lachnospiraceae bacterium]|nr:reverse transcriptase [Lachnospiraceae bacterium]